MRCVSPWARKLGCRRFLFFLPRQRKVGDLSNDDERWTVVVEDPNSSTAKFQAHASLYGKSAWFVPKKLFCNLRVFSSVPAKVGESVSFFPPVRFRSWQGC